MAARIVVFPVHGRRWAFAAVASSQPAGTQQIGGGAAAGTLLQLFQKLRESKHAAHRAELVTRYMSEKMHENWVALGKAPDGSVRNRVHGIGETLLSRLKPSEPFLKSIPRDASRLQIIFPSSLNPRLVRRRVRHIAMSGAHVHKRYMYGSFALLPFTALLTVVPVPNIPLYWNLFRAHAHWQALQGGRRLLLLVSDDAESLGSSPMQSRKEKVEEVSSSIIADSKTSRGQVLLPSETLESMVLPMQVKTLAMGDSTIAAVCQEFSLDSSQILKWRDYKET